MNFIINLTEKILKKIPILNKLANRETISYLIFGVLTTIVNYVVYIISMEIFASSGISDSTNEQYIWAVNISTVIAWVLAVAFAYITNKLYVFESKSFKLKVVLKESAAFVAARLFSGICELIWMFLVVGQFEMNDKLAKILANVFVIIMNYFFSKFFIFKNDKKEA